jgi:two-component system NtrC family sensor kinase
MRLAIKLVSLIVFVVLIILALDGYVSFRRAARLFDNDMERDAHVLGRSLKVVLTDVWRSEGTERALQLVEDANREEDLVQVRWVWLDARPDTPHGPQMPVEDLEPVARGEEVSFRRRDEDGHVRLLTYVPLLLGTNRLAALELSENSPARDVYLHATVIRVGVLTFTLGLVSTILTVLLGVVMVGWPLHSLNQKARRIGAGDLSGTLRLRGSDELSSLASTMNEMCEQLAAARDAIHAEADARIAAMHQLRHVDRLRTVGTLAAGIAHEMGTPLNVVSGRAGLIASGDLSSAEIVESANIVKAQSERMTAVIRQFLDFSRTSNTEKNELDLRPVAERCVKLLTPMADKRKARLRVVSEEAPRAARANPDEIQQVLTNLIVNALQAMPKGGGTVEVGVRHEHAAPPHGYQGSERDWLCLFVRDEGKGISAEHAERLFEPFFTTKDVGEGTGLGLSIAHGIVRDHGGWIGVASEPGRGSCFSVYLPQEGPGCEGES